MEKVYNDMVRKRFRKIASSVCACSIFNRNGLTATCTVHSAKKPHEKRQSGVLMHFFLPGQYGSDHSVNQHMILLISSDKQRYWQILPLGTVSIPIFLSFAEDAHLLISDLFDWTVYWPVDLKRWTLVKILLKWIMQRFSNNVDLYLKKPLRTSWNQVIEEFQAFCQVIFLVGTIWEYMAIEHFDLKPGQNGQMQLFVHVNSFWLNREEVADQLTYIRVTQFFFFQQWLALKTCQWPSLKSSRRYACGRFQWHVGRPHLFKTDKKLGRKRHCPADGLSNWSAGGTQSMTGKQWTKDGYQWWIGAAWKLQGFESYRICWIRYSTR